MLNKWDWSSAVCCWHLIGSPLGVPLYHFKVSFCNLALQRERINGSVGKTTVTGAQWICWEWRRTTSGKLQSGHLRAIDWALVWSWSQISRRREELPAQFKSRARDKITQGRCGDKFILTTNCFQQTFMKTWCLISCGLVYFSLHGCF